MTTKFFLIQSYRVPNGGINPIMLGYPEPRYQDNDICLCKIGTANYIPLNAGMLREALLSNPEMTKQLLAIEVKDVKEEMLHPKKKKEVAKQPKPTTTLDNEEAK